MSDDVTHPDIERRRGGTRLAHVAIEVEVSDELVRTRGDRVVGLGLEALDVEEVESRHQPSLLPVAVGVEDGLALLPLLPTHAHKLSKSV